jgi:hypothetical protein
LSFRDATTPSWFAMMSTERWGEMSLPFGLRTEGATLEDIAELVRGLS